MSGNSFTHRQPPAKAKRKVAAVPQAGLELVLVVVLVLVLVVVVLAAAVGREPAVVDLVDLAQVGRLIQSATLPA